MRMMVNLFSFMFDQVEGHDTVVGKLAAKNKDVIINLYYTPSKLTENSLVFNKVLMRNWWQQGFEYAADKAKQAEDNKIKNIDLAG